MYVRVVDAATLVPYLSSDPCLLLQTLSALNMNDNNLKGTLPTNWSNMPVSSVAEMCAAILCDSCRQSLHLTHIV